MTALTQSSQGLLWAELIGGWLAGVAVVLAVLRWIWEHGREGSKRGIRPWFLNEMRGTNGGADTPTGDQLGAIKKSLDAHVAESDGHWTKTNATLAQAAADAAAARAMAEESERLVRGIGASVEQHMEADIDYQAINDGAIEHIRGSLATIIDLMPKRAADPPQAAAKRAAPVRKAVKR